MKRVSTLLVAARALRRHLSVPPFAQTQVGIVLPTKDEPRWIQDQTRFQDALKTAGINAEILFSQGDSAKEKANVEALITKGIKVLIICPQDGAAAAAAADAANKAGVKVISYDRLIRDTASVDYYVTFDSVQVGAAWGNYLVSKASRARATTSTSMPAPPPTTTPSSSSRAPGASSSPRSPTAPSSSATPARPSPSRRRPS